MNVLPISLTPFAQCRGIVFQYSLINQFAAVRGQCTSRPGAVGPVLTCDHSLFLLLHQGRCKLGSPSSSALLSTVISSLVTSSPFTKSEHIPDLLPAAVSFSQALFLAISLNPVFPKGQP